VSSPPSDARAREASALLAANQRLRVAATWTFVLAALLGGGGVVVAVVARELVVLLPLPAPTCLLYALGLQQFAEVSVLGSARRRLELVLAAELEGEALFYERDVAGVRQREPLVASVRVLQAAWSLAVLATLIAATWTAFQSGFEWWVPVGYCAVTAPALLAVCLSYRDMLRSGRLAAEQLAVGERSR